MRADAPGIGLILMEWLIKKLINCDPGSEINGEPESEIREIK